MLKPRFDLSLKAYEYLYNAGYEAGYMGVDDRDKIRADIKSGRFPLTISLRQPWLRQGPPRTLDRTSPAVERIISEICKWAGIKTPKLQPKKHPIHVTITRRVCDGTGVRTVRRYR